MEKTKVWLTDGVEILTRPHGRGWPKGKRPHRWRLDNATQHQTESHHQQNDIPIELGLPAWCAADWRSCQSSVPYAEIASCPRTVFLQGKRLDLYLAERHGNGKRDMGMLGLLFKWDDWASPLCMHWALVSTLSMETDWHCHTCECQKKFVKMVKKMLRWIGCMLR